MGFKLTRKVAIDANGTEYQEYEHERLGARHIHVKADTPELAFAVSLPTLPETDDGRAHILEHLALCGSERFPGRDPFFGMTRRSLASFMNAMTYPDRTVYPFATQDPKDFENLLSVYVDAVFFPLLRRHDFLQEGWRHEIKNGELQLHGVVLNEMKGAYAEPTLAAEMGIESALKKGTSYATSYGGDPLAIPSLAHEDLLEFHHAHYHPSRAIFCTYGAVDPLEAQETLERLVMSRFSDRLEPLSPQKAAPLAGVQALDIPTPPSDGEDGHGFAAAWVVGARGQDDDAIEDWFFFFAALCSNSASPLMSAMENAGFGRPSDMMALGKEGAQATLTLAMEGLAADEAKKARALIFNALESVAKKGLPQETLDALLRDFEIDAREPDMSSGTPGVAKMLDMIPYAMNGADPSRAIDHESALRRARANAQDSGFIPRMARALLDMPGRVEARLTPKANYFSAREKKEKEALAAALKAMGPQERARIESEAQALREQQGAAPDNSLLPRVKPEDIRREILPSAPVAFEASESGPSAAWVEAATDGVGRLKIQWDATSLPRELWPWAGAFAELALDVGLDGMGHEEAEAWRDKAGADFGLSFDGSLPAASLKSDLALRLSIDAKALEPDARRLGEALARTVLKARFNESSRVKFLIQSAWQQARQELADMGPQFARANAKKSFGALGVFESAMEGAEGLRFLQELNELSKTQKGLAHIQAKLEEAQRAVAAAPALMAWIGSAEAGQEAFAAAREAMPARAGWASTQMPGATAEALGLAEEIAAAGPGAGDALLGGGQVNHCVASWQGPRREHADAGAMPVLAAYLKNAFLHRALREQGGAYGASASHDPETGVFTVSSFRDPRVSGTFEDIEAAVRFAIEEPVSEEALGEAITSAMKQTDRIQSPAGRAAAALALAQAGFGEAARQTHRDAKLACDAQTLQNAARRWLGQNAVSRCAFVCRASEADAVAAGLSPKEVAGEKKPAPRRALKR